MKKILFSFFLFSVMAVGVNAQQSSCSKSCAAKPGASASACGSKSSSANAGTSAESAAKLASMDASIESRTCPVSGTVSYVRKETNAKSATVSYVDVTYDATTNAFVNVSPVKMEGSSSCGPKNTSASGKSCCAGKSASASGSKSCCSGKTKTASAGSSSSDAVKTVTPAKG